MENQAGKQADAEFQNQCFDHRGGIEKQVVEAHADGSRESPLPAAQQQSCQNTDGIARMDKLVRDRDPEHEHHKADGGKHRREHQAQDTVLWRCLEFSFFHR